MRNGFVSHTAGGALGGIVGTMFMMRASRQASHKLPERLKPTATRRDPGDFLVRQIEELRGRPLPREAHERIAGALHWAYGIGWGGLLGLGLSVAHRKVRSLPAAVLVGSGLGAAVWAVGYAGWLPALRLTPPVTRQGGRHVLTSLLMHVGYGIVATVPLLVLDAVVQPEPRWRRLARRLLGGRVAR